MSDAHTDSHTDTSDSTEIEIKLDSVNNDSAVDDKPVDGQPTHEKTYKPVEPKHIANLTDDERATIIASVRNGIEQPYYDVKFYKNGNTRIIKRKLKKPSTAEQIINSQPLPPTTEAKRYYTDNQLLFEHIIELNAKIDRLTAKHKKLKKKYTTIRNDIYADEDDIVEPSPLTKFDDETPTQTLSNANGEGEPSANSLSKSSIITESRMEQSTAHSQTPFLYNALSLGYPPYRSNWRSQVKYL